MDRKAAIEALNSLLHGTVNSVVQYIEVATPYVPPGYEEQWKQVLAMRDEETGMAHELTDAIGELDGVPSVGVFPYWNVDLNYLDLRFLARFAAEQLEGVIEENEEMVDECRDHARVHGLLTRILEQKRRHRDALRGIAGLDEPAGESDGEPADEPTAKPDGEAAEAAADESAASSGG